MRLLYPSKLQMLLVVVLLLVPACSTFDAAGDVDDLETRNAQLQGTIEGMGTPAATIVALEMTADRGIVLQAEMNNVQATALAAQATLTMIQLNGGAPPPAAAAPAAPAPAAATGVGVDMMTPAEGVPGDQAAPGAGTPPPTSQQATPTVFSQTTTATGRDVNDCATGVTAVFESTQETIYVITRINLLPADSVLSARWFANGSLFYDDMECWIPEQDWVNVCAYCSIVPDAAAFETGNWSVEMLLNGQLMSQAQFQIVDPAQQGADAAQ